MKKIFATSLFLGLASLSQAAFVQCAPPQSDVVINAVGTTAVFACNLGGANQMSDGLSITQIRLRVSGTFQENAGTPGQNFSVLYSSTNNGSGLASGALTPEPSTAPPREQPTATARPSVLATKRARGLAWPAIRISTPPSASA